MKVSGRALRSIMGARGFTVQSLALRAEIQFATLEEVANGTAEIDEGDVERLAEQLAVPVEALFAESSLPLFASIDFRSRDPSIAMFEKGVLDAISFVERISSTVSALSLDVSLDASLDVFAGELIERNAISLAGLWRGRWGMTDELQLELHDANRMYARLREFIEDRGVMVIHRSFKTDQAAGLYAHIEDGPHAIVINSSKSSKARKLFTLAHEFCHVLLRKEGASNPSISTNIVEAFCNKFAAYLLAPDSLVTEAVNRYRYNVSSDARTIRLIAEKMGISQEATAIRLVETHLLTEEEFRAWKSRFVGVTPPADLGEEEGGGGSSDPLQTKRTLYGTRLLRLLSEALRKDQLDPIDIYRLSGLKPKYQLPLFGIV